MAHPRESFDIAPGITYMDAATFGLPPRDTVTAVQEALAAWAAGTADWIADWDRPAELTRADFAALVGVPESSVALLPAVSVAVGWIAATLQSGDEVVVPTDEFTSTLFPFLVARERGIVVREVDFAGLPAAIDARTTIVATSLVQMQTGLRADLPAIRAEKVRRFICIPCSKQGAGCKSREVAFGVHNCIRARRRPIARDCPALVWVEILLAHPRPEAVADGAVSSGGIRP